MKFFLYTFTLLTLLSLPLHAQDFEAETEESEAPERVKYALVLPSEKTPELLKADENNPFEVSGSDGLKEVDTEENRVRDILLSMPAVGGGSGPEGMRVMLGSMRLEVGQEVPSVLPDQQVMLKVKAITAHSIEMVWVEKKPTGLPPKTFVIDVDVSPRVRYRMPTSGANGGSMGVMTRDGSSALSRPPVTPPAEAPPETRLAIKAVSAEEPVKDSAPPKNKPASPQSNLPEASVLRMLFGNHAQPK
jgi:hypothetical protein